ncbi:MAG: hypothetical protein M1835_004701 [Candelina submexicana]|nr:MAG: hypothetical protein M1835_004701 [Candelina submexicana]
MVTWWSANVEGEAESINLLVEPKTGFTEKLLRHRKSEKLLAWVDGPYGIAKDIRSFGCVLMFATGMGIAAQLPYIKELIREYRNYNTSTRRITIIWQLHRESDQSWIGDWMNELLEEDDGSYILKVSLYVLREFDDKETEYGQKKKYGTHHRISKYYGKADLVKLMSMEWEKRRGKMLITVSTDDVMRDQIRAIVKANMVEADTELVDIAFQPMSIQNIWQTKRADVEHHGVV